MKPGKTVTITDFNRAGSLTGVTTIGGLACIIVTGVYFGWLALIPFVTFMFGVISGASSQRRHILRIGGLFPTAALVQKIKSEELEENTLYD